MTKKIVKFRAVKIVKKLTTVSFRTKSGERVSFRAIKAIEKPVTVKFTAKRKKR